MGLEAIYGDNFTRRDTLKITAASAGFLLSKDIIKFLPSFMDDASSKLASMNIILDSVTLEKSGHLSFISLSPDMFPGHKDKTSHTRAVKVELPIETSIFNSSNADLVREDFSRYLQSVQEYANWLDNIKRTGPAGTLGMMAGFTGTRRSFLQTIPLMILGGGLLIARWTALSSCLGRDQTQLTSTPEGNGTLQAITTASPDIKLTPLPPTPDQFIGIGAPLTAQYFTQQANLIKTSIEQDNPDELKPQSTPVPTTSEKTPIEKAKDTVEESIIYTEQVFNTQLRNRLTKELDTQNSLGWLKHVVAQGTRRGINGGVNYWLPGLDGQEAPYGNMAVYREKLALTPEAIERGYKDIPSEYTEINDGYPKKLHLRYGNSIDDSGTGFSILGINQDNNNEIVIAFEENLPRIPNDPEFHEPRMRLGVITRQELGEISTLFMKNLKYYPLGNVDQAFNQLRYDFFDEESGTNVIKFVTLNTISGELMEQIKKETGEVWYEKMPSVIENGVPTEFSFFPNPVIPKLDQKRDDLPEGFDWENAKLKILNLKPGDKNFNLLFPNDPTAAVIFAMDENSNTLLSARFDGKEWKWRNPDIYVRDYADALSVENGVAITGSWFTEFTPGYTKKLESEYTERLKQFCNTVTIPLFAWESIEPQQNQFDIGTFQFIDRLIDNFHSLGIKTIRGQALIQPAMFPKWLVDDVRTGKINEENLWNTVKEHVTMLVKWGKGEGIASIGIPSNGSRRINQWTAITEPFRHYGYENNEDILQTKLGDTYIDNICQLVRDLDPEVEIIVEDVNNHVTEGWNSIHNVSQADTTLQSQELARRLWNNGQIDRFGVEAFLDGANPPVYQNMTDTLFNYNVPIDITSFNIDMRNIGGTQENRWNTQGVMYENSRDAMFASKNVVGFSVWENGDSWNYSDPKRGGNANADPTTLDDNLNLKPAHFGIVNSYRKQLGFQPLLTT